MSKNLGKNKAALAYQILGRYLPDSVFDHLKTEEIESLLEKVDTNRKPTANEEKNLLLSFTKYLQKSPKTNPIPEYSLFPQKPKANLASLTQEEENLAKMLEEILAEEQAKTSFVDELQTKSVSELSLLANDESPLVIARLLAFANPEEASEVIGQYPDSIREEIIFSLSEIDFHSAQERDELERFLKFKSELIASKTPMGKVRSRKAKTAGVLLTRLPLQHSQNLIERIQKKSPEFAETIIEHYFRMEDLLHLGRTSFTKFLSEIHPLVIACALKGVEISLRDSIFENLEAWLVKEIRLEWDSIGPVSLLEIKEAQKGVLDLLRDDIEEGKVKLWRIK
ncbi:MAG: endoflagellar motor switch protein [Leptospira sp.]|nr:endoflagellar motor switch protein [Leptospira sp.]